jgi:hypothetical protein
VLGREDRTLDGSLRQLEDIARGLTLEHVVGDFTSAHWSPGPAGQSLDA